MHTFCVFVRPCCQIDLYSILARAPPAELGSAAAPNLDGDEAERANTTISKKADKKSRQEKALSRKISNIEGKGERRTFQMAAGPAPLEGYSARDPLGKEVAELDANAQERLRR